jgi:lipopolysaccharide transport system ATP-binding protein
MFPPLDTREQRQDVIIVENVSKHFRIPHEKKTKLLEHIAGALKGSYSTYEEFWALKNISFKVKNGDTLALIGENGSGKSTLLKMIAGVLSPDSGSIKVNGKIAPFLELGVGFQPELTAEENVRLYGAVMGMTRSEIERKFDDIFDFAELSKFKNMKLKNFSSGMYTRLAFSTAIATEPDILLVDEVLSVGDEAFQKKCVEKFNEFKREGKTIVLVSHSLDMVEKICKESILLFEGKLISRGDSQKVIDDYRRKIQEKRGLQIKEENDKLNVQEEKEPAKIEEKKEEEKEKTESVNNYTRELEIKEVKLYEKSRNETYSFNSGDELIIRVKYEKHKKVSNPLFQIQIHRDDGVFVHGMNTGREDIEIGEIDKDGEFEYIIKNLSLLEGTYYANVGIVSSWDGPHYDYQSGKYKFIIRSKKADGAGIVTMKHKWNLEK